MNQQKTFQYNGALISYRVIGKGVPFLLLHGFGEDGSVFYPIATALEQDTCFIIPDLPGSGLSAAAISLQSHWRMDDFAHVMLAMMQHEHIDRFIMAGHSMGGYITLAMAEKYPDVLIGIGLIHSTAFADSEEMKVNRLRSIAFIEKHGATKFLSQTTPNLFGDAFRTAQSAQLANHITTFSVFSKEALVVYYDGMMKRPDRTIILSTFKNPVFFIIGDKDKAVNLEESLKQIHLAIDTQITIFENVGHMGMIEYPLGTINALKQFLIKIKSN